VTDERPAQMEGRCLNGLNSTFEASSLTSVEPDGSVSSYTTT